MTRPTGKAQAAPPVPPARRHTAHRRRHAGRQAPWRTVGLVWCAVALLGSGTLSALWLEAGSSVAQAASQPTTYLTLSLAPGTQGLATGQTLTVTVSRTASGTAAGVEIRKVLTGWCAPATTLPTVLPSSSLNGTSTVNVLPQIPNVLCTTPTFPVLESSPTTDVQQPISVISPPANATTNYPTASGTTFVQESTGAQLRTGVLACNASHSCTFAVAVYVTFNTHVKKEATYFLSAPVTYLPATVNSSCGGAAAGALSAVGPDRLGGLITKWTVDACQAKVGGGKALAGASTASQSDDSALCAFASGRADFAYSAVGYGTAKSPFNPANCTGGAEPDRPYVAVPIALDAVDLSHTQTINGGNNAANLFSFRHYARQPHATDAQAAQLLGTGGLQSWTGGELGPALVTETATLANDYFYTRTPTTAGFAPLAHASKSGARGFVVTSGTVATAFIATRFLQATAPTTLLSPTPGHKKVGTIANFANSTPKLDVDPATGFNLILHAITPGAAQAGMPWALISATDARALWFGMANFALQVPGTSPPVFASPTTPGELQRAVAHMATEPDGTKLLDLTSVAHLTVATANAQQPYYPLTYVEYAIVPTQPLMGANCTLRTQSQTNLTDWLDYITGVGQTELATGLAPLPTTLQQQALSAIAQVGESPPGCIPAKVTTTTSKSTATGGSTATVTTGGSGGKAATTATTAPAAGGSVAAEASRTGSSYSGSTGSYAGSATGGSGTPGGSSTSPGTTPSGQSPTPHRKTRATTALAGFETPDGPGWLLPFGAVLLLIVLLPGLVLVISGRSPRQVAAAVRAALTGQSPPPPEGPSPPGGGTP